MANRNLNQRMRASLYSLKREYGGRIDIYKKGVATADTRTGEREISKTLTVIQRAIILPAEFARREVRGISLISANKTLVVGGQYDGATRIFVVDRRDAPSLALTKDDWIIFDGKKWEVHEFEEYEFDTAWIIVAKCLIGETPEQIFNLSADNLLDLSQPEEKVEIGESGIPGPSPP